MYLKNKSIVALFCQMLVNTIVPQTLDTQINVIKISELKIAIILKLLLNSRIYIMSEVARRKIVYDHVLKLKTIPVLKYLSCNS